MEFPKPNSDCDWKSTQFRQKVVAHIQIVEERDGDEQAIDYFAHPEPAMMQIVGDSEEAMRKGGTAHTVCDMENDAFVKAKSREEYLTLMARVITHFRDLHKVPSGPGGAGPMQQNAMQQQQNTLQQHNAAIQQQSQVQQQHQNQEQRAQNQQQQNQASSQASPAEEGPGVSDFSPALVKLKDEPMDEEYSQALTSTTSTAGIKDEPDAKEPSTGSSLRVYAVRVGPGQELLGALLAFVEERGLRAPFIITCVGSVTKATLRLANATAENTNEVMHLQERFEIVSLVGTLNKEAHLHICLADKEGKTVGGHVLGDLQVFTTAEVVIGEAADLQFTRELDEHTGFPELVIQPRSQRD